MGSIMDQERPWERDDWNAPRKETVSAVEKFVARTACEHEWKSKFDFVYDYDHQYCTKCAKTRMV